MSGYFSFQKLITTWFVQVLYFVGFLLISAGGIGLAVWAGLRLRDASISRELGWRYVAAGVGALILGNILWRVFCEIWIVIFRVHDELLGIHYTIGDFAFQRETPPVAEVHEHVDVEHAPTATEVRPVRSFEEHPRSASVLGLS